MNIFKKYWKQFWCLHPSQRFKDPVYKSRKDNIWEKELFGYNYECNHCEKIIFRERTN